MATSDTATTATPTFRRGLDKPFCAALAALTDAPDGSWWRDVLARRDLLLAVRDGYLNVYHRGAAIYRVERRGDALVPVRHPTWKTPTAMRCD